MVLRALADDNATLEQGDRVTIDSIRNHTAYRRRFGRGRRLIATDGKIF